MSELTLTGSCLCGAVQYRVTGDSKAFVHCHCKRCRKASGTGHASNILVQSDHIEWLSGEELLGRYDVPDAVRFHTLFCGRCGSPAPRIIKEENLVVIPAGTLDEDPAIRPQARIFWGSRAEWSCTGAELKQFEEYPTG
jgi:hypothetical protein